MAYRIVAFDALPVPEYIRAGDNQDMGTGSALTSFLPLPGGGFYDNYQDRKSPQGIRPLSKSGLFWGTDDELEAEINAWRAKIGVRGRLAVEWDNGALRWQWARLQDVSCPRPREAKGGWLPFTFTWITAAQNWRGVVYGEEGWTWGDGSWFFGDGSAEMGVGSQTFTNLSNGQFVTITHNGSIDASNVLLRLNVVGEWDNLTIVNYTTGQQININRDAPSSIPMIEIDAGARAMYAVGPVITTTTMTRIQNTLSITTNGAHGLSSGTTARIENAGGYNGDYYPVTAVGSTGINVPIAPRRSRYGIVTTAQVRSLSDLYSFATISDKERWLVFAPGDNALQFTWSPMPSQANLTVEFADHYA